MKTDSQPETPKSKRSKFNKGIERKEKPSLNHPRPGKKIRANKLILKRTYSTLTSGIDERLAVASSGEGSPCAKKTEDKLLIEHNSPYSRSLNKSSSGSKRS
jgi:hypothetical protein